MAKLPIYTTNWQTLTQIFPIQQTNVTAPKVLTPIPPSLRFTTDLYIDVNTINTVIEYFDQMSQTFVDARIISLVGDPTIIVVKDSYDTIKAFMDARDCNSLCNDV